MSKEEFMILVKTMKAVHPAMFPEMDTINIWYKMLADLNAVCETLKFVGRYPSK